jgi:fucose 4-O-acetylase-like acetyltransferase
VGSTFSLSRTIGLLPFFVLGWKLREWGIADRWVAARRSVPWVRGIAVLVFAAWVAVIVVFLAPFRKIDLQHWLFFRDPYSEIAGGQWWAGLVRLGFIVLAVVLSAAFLALVPRRRTWITDLGQATMYVYLLHTFVLYPVRESGILTRAQPANLWLVGMILAAVAISLALASPFVRRIFRPLVEPRLRWLYASEDPPQ